MKNNDLTAIAVATGVLLEHRKRHRPPIDHISPTVAQMRDSGWPEAVSNDVEETDIPLLAQFVHAMCMIASFWVIFVAAWAMWPGGGM